MAGLLPAGIGNGVSAGGTRYTSFIALYLAAGLFTMSPCVLNLSRFFPITRPATSKMLELRYPQLLPGLIPAECGASVRPCPAAYGAQGFDVSKPATWAVAVACAVHVQLERVASKEARVNATLAGAAAAEAETEGAVAAAVSAAAVINSLGTSSARPASDVVDQQTQTQSAGGWGDEAGDVQGGEGATAGSEWARGTAVQVDPIKPTLKAPGAKPLQLKYDEMLSKFAFEIDLRRYNEGWTSFPGCRCPSSRCRQGLTLVHFSTYCEHSLRDTLGGFMEFR